MRISDWSSDVCSSDLLAAQLGHAQRLGEVQPFQRLRKFGSDADVHGRITVPLLPDRDYASIAAQSRHSGLRGLVHLRPDLFEVLVAAGVRVRNRALDRKSTRLNSSH